MTPTEEIKAEAPQLDMPQALILSHPRSGTHLLISLLQSHPKISGRGECYLRYKRWLSAGSNDDADLRHFRNKPDKLNVAILMYNLYEFSQVHTHDLKMMTIIHLLRDPLKVGASCAQYDANKRAYVGYKAHYKAGEEAPGNAPFDPGETVRVAASVNRLQKEFGGLLDGHPKVLTLSYEEISKNQSVSEASEELSRRLLRFLGLEYHTPLTTSLKKGGG